MKICQNIKRRRRRNRWQERHAILLLILSHLLETLFDIFPKKRPISFLTLFCPFRTSWTIVCAVSLFLQYKELFACKRRNPCPPYVLCCCDNYSTTFVTRCWYYGSSPKEDVYIGVKQLVLQKPLSYRHAFSLHSTFHEIFPKC